MGPPDTETRNMYKHYSRHRPPASPTAAPARCWVLSDGKTGTERQCLALAEAVGAEIRIRRLRPRAPWVWLPPDRWPCPWRALGPDSDALLPPWPDLVIAGSRRCAPYLIALRRTRPADERPRTVYIHDPRVDPALFDLVIAPRHDRLVGANVVATLGALHGVTPARLRAAADAARGLAAHLPHPLVAVLVGGETRRMRLPPAAIDRLCDGLAGMVRTQGVGLLVTTSRRTAPPAHQRLAERLRGLPALLWDGHGSGPGNGPGANPYLGFLALAKAIVVTADSIAMLSEAAATGKPVHVFAPDGGSARFNRFHAAMAAHGATRPFAGRLEHWRYPPIGDMTMAAAALRRLLHGPVCSAA